jgi:hypothetical protein
MTATLFNDDASTTEVARRRIGWEGDREYVGISREEVVITYF